MAIEGGCLCGNVRYRAVDTPIYLTACHCENCRRASGAPYVAWVTVPKRGFAFIAGDPMMYTYVRDDGNAALRYFCATCGTQLTYEDSGRADQLDITVGSADDAESLAPTQNVHTDEKLSWALDNVHETRDGLE